MGGEILENVVEEILFDTLKSNTENLKCSGLLSLFKNKDKIRL